MKKGSVIVLDSYEKHSFIRFLLIYTLALLFLFFATASLYYYKESHRYFSEQKLLNKIEYAECVHLKRLLADPSSCKMKPVIIDDRLNIIYKEIFLAFLLTLMIILPLGFFLARLSLRPIRDSIDSMDSFINGIIHDINTPLSVIQMNAQAIDKAIDDERLKRKTFRLLQASKQIESLEEQLLFSMRVGQHVLQKSTFDLKALLMKKKSHYANIRQSVILTLDCETLEVYADKAMLERMIDNIIINAIKYSKSNGEVWVTLTETSLSVQDYGIGIKEPKMIFSKYYREAKETKGIGIGLYIVAEVARLHEIDIDVQSTVGVGTTFKVSLERLSPLLLHK